MKHSIHLPLLLCLIIVFTGVSSLQAQQTASLTVSSSSKTFDSVYSAANFQQAESGNKAYTLNMAAGQHAARFDGLNAYIKNHLTYPQKAKENGIEGTVQVLAFISAEGAVLDAKIIESIGFGCDEAALDLVRNMPVWTPAMNYGIPVKGKKLLEIKFRLR